MLESEPMPWFGLIFLIAFFSFCFFQAYLLLRHPASWVEWFVRKLWKSFGIAVSIADEQKFRRQTTFLGMVYLISGIIMLGFFVSVGAFGR